ncbi:MAG TPA: hypothetical protein VGP07_19590 [Polyangia bacterium]|jgi:hypothetical protein
MSVPAVIPNVRNVRLAGRAAPLREPLRSPVSGVSCVYWRLRIVEELDPSLRLVHEIASEEPFEIVDERADEAGGPGRVRVLPGSADIQGTASLHRPGSPGSRAAGRHFELSGALGVEEIILRPGDEIVAEGMLEGFEGERSPFRAPAREHELLGALVRLPTRHALGPVLLPWALGTAAAVLGGVGVATWAATHFDLLPHLRHAVAAPVPEMGPLHTLRRHFSQPE